MLNKLHFVHTIQIYCKIFFRFSLYVQTLVEQSTMCYAHFKGLGIKQEIKHSEYIDFLEPQFQNYEKVSGLYPIV